MNVTESYVSGARGMPQAKVPGRSHGNRGDRGSVRSPTGPDNILGKRPFLEFLVIFSCRNGLKKILPEDHSASVSRMR